MADTVSFLDRHHFLLRRLHSLTGVAPIGIFLVFHLVTNSSVAWGMLDSRKGETFIERGVRTYQSEVDFIHSAPFLLLVEVFGLWLPIAFHSILGFVYAAQGRSNTASYGWGANWRYTLQRLSGYLGIVFIFYHVATLRWGWKFLVPGRYEWSHHEATSTLALAIRGGTDITPLGIAVALLYLSGASLLVFHFANGLWTAAITWGLTISRSAQVRWGYVCAGLGVSMLAMTWAALAVLLFAPVSVMQQVESRMNAERASGLENPIKPEPESLPTPALPAAPSPSTAPGV